MTSERLLAEASSESTPGSRLVELTAHRDKAVRASVAKNPNTPTAVLERLAADKHHLPRYGVAENPEPRAWQIALEARDSGVRVILAQRQDLDGETLRALLDDPDHRVRRSLAVSSRRPEVIAELVRDRHANVRSASALSKVLSQKDLELLARDADANVRATAAQSRRLSEETVQHLVRDRSYMVRYELLWARPERVDIAQALRHDKEPIVADLAEDCLRPPPWMRERLTELSELGHIRS